MGAFMFSCAAGGALGPSHLTRARCRVAAERTMVGAHRQDRAGTGADQVFFLVRFIRGARTGTGREVPAGPLELYGRAGC